MDEQPGFIERGEGASGLVGWVCGEVDDGIGAEADVDAGCKHFAIAVRAQGMWRVEVVAGARAVCDACMGAGEDGDRVVGAVVAMRAEPVSAGEIWGEMFDGMMTKAEVCVCVRAEEAEGFEESAVRALRMLNEVAFVEGFGQVCREGEVVGRGQAECGVEGRGLGRVWRVWAQAEACAVGCRCFGCKGVEQLVKACDAFVCAIADGEELDETDTGQRRGSERVPRNERGTGGGAACDVTNGDDASGE